MPTERLLNKGSLNSKFDGTSYMVLNIVRVIVFNSAIYYNINLISNFQTIKLVLIVREKMGMLQWGLIL